MDNETKMIEILKSDKYIFTVMRDSSGKFYANAQSLDQADKYWHRWTSGTLKSVRATIYAFDPNISVIMR